VANDRRLDQEGSKRLAAVAPLSVNLVSPEGNDWVPGGRPFPCLPGKSGMAISVEHDVPLMAPNVLNDGDSGVFECAGAPFGDVALPPGSHGEKLVSWSFI
jgi:hypothetical protein